MMTKFFLSALLGGGKYSLRDSFCASYGGITDVLYCAFYPFSGEGRHYTGIFIIGVVATLWIFVVLAKIKLRKAACGLPFYYRRN